MNLDDFIVAESVAPPAGGLAGAPSPEATKYEEDKPAHSFASAMNIHKYRKASLQVPFAPQSVPVAPNGPRAHDEFGYITRHHRKTSIDDRRVSSCPFLLGNHFCPGAIHSLVSAATGILICLA